MMFALILILIYEYLKWYYIPINQMFFEPSKFQLNENNGRKHMVVAIDFDNTIVYSNYPKIIKPLPYALDVIKILMNDKYTTLILWTCREGKDLEDALNWLDIHNIHFDYINENSKERIELYGTNPRKIGADLFIDDHSYEGIEGIERLWKNWYFWIKENKIA